MGRLDRLFGQQFPRFHSPRVLLFALGYFPIRIGKCKWERSRNTCLRNPGICWQNGYGRLYWSAMSEVTRILTAIEQGDPHAAEQLLPLVYDELRQLAAQK